MANRYYQGPRSDHFDGERFFNPGAPATDKSLFELAKWRLGGRPARWPASVPVRQAVPDAHVAGLRVTHVGHATVLIQAAGVNILTDPVWSDRASPFRIAGPKRVTAPGIAFDALPPIHAVLLSHNHYDHMDTTTLARLHAAHDPLLVLPLGNDAIVRSAVPGMRITSGDWGDTIPLAPEVDAVLVPANHWSARWLADRRMALWCGYVVRTPVGKVYFAGDTAYAEGTIFRRIAADYGLPDVALVPIGAYAPRWFMRPQHIDPEEAVRIVQDLGARQALGIHWGTFQLTDESREEPPARFTAAAEASGIGDLCKVAQPGGHYALLP